MESNQESMGPTPVQPGTLPICPHCKADPVAIAIAFVGLAGMNAAVFHCGDCRAALTVQMVGAQRPQEQPPQQSSSIIRPY